MTSTTHQILVPVYIPSTEGFYEQALDVLKLCLRSLQASVRGKARVRVVANRCAPEVVQELLQARREGLVDHLSLSARNLGKINAVAPLARCSAAELTTVTDCDVFFRPGWIEAVHEVFRTFPECGTVSPAAVPSYPWYCTSAVVLGAMLRGELGLAPRATDFELRQFFESIGQPHRVDSMAARRVVVKRNAVTACVGSGHFVLTMRREVVNAIPSQPTPRSCRDRADGRYLDQPADRLGFWRLALADSFAFHIGNVPEPWMWEALESDQRSDSPEDAPDALPPMSPGWVRSVPWQFRTRLVWALRRAGVAGLILRRFAPEAL